MIDLSEAERSWLRTHPVIHLGTDPDFAPYEWLDSKGRHVGLMADYFALLSEKLGIKFEVVQGKIWAEMVEMAKRSEIAMLSDAMRPPEREQFLTFSEPMVVRMPMSVMALPPAMPCSSWGCTDCATPARSPISVNTGWPSFAGRACCGAGCTGGDCFRQ
jgi:hypothetical protein